MGWFKEKLSRSVRSRSSDSIIASPDHRNKDIAEQDYYHGLLPRHDTNLLLNKDGDFLVRKTDIAEKRTLVLSAKSKQGIQHYPIVQDDTGMCWIEDTRKFNSVSLLVDCYYMTKAPLADGVQLRYAVTRQAWELKHEHIFLADKLGEGNFAQVYKGILLLDESRYQWVAVKKLHTMAQTKDERSEFLREASVLRNYSDNRIVRMLGIAAERQPLLIVIELMEGGTLLNRLRLYSKDMSTLQKVLYSLNASQGMRYLEKMGCIHRDLAARNCLLDKSGSLKIADFGLSVQASTHKEKTELKVAIKWIAPEYLKKQVCSTKSDVWSFGILLWEIFSGGQEPYPDWNCSQTYAKVVNEKYKHSPPATMPKPVQDLMSSCLEYRPEHRPTFLKIKKKLYDIEVKAGTGQI